MPVTDSYDLINSPDTTTYNLTENDEYDSPWKEAVDNYFPEFIEFYFPEAYTQIDWSEEPTLKTSNNSFAIVTATHILTQQTQRAIRMSINR